MIVNALRAFETDRAYGPLRAEAVRSAAVVAGALRDALTTMARSTSGPESSGWRSPCATRCGSGNLYLAEIRHYVSFWTLIYSDDTWSQRRERAYTDLRISPEPDHALDALRVEFDQAARSVMDGLIVDDHQLHHAQRGCH